MRKSLAVMVAEQLTASGHDGLVNTLLPCGCGIDDLMPCDCPNIHGCVAAYKNTHSATKQVIYSERHDLNDEQISRALLDC